MKRLLVLVALLCSFTKGFAQQDSTLHLSDFIKEIEQTSDQNRRIAIVLWMPWQYWEAAMIQGNNGKPLTQSMRDMVNSMKQYTILCVVDAKPGVYGLDYYNEDQLRDSVKLTVNDSLTFKPLDEKSLNETMRMLLNLMKPMMSSMLGQMGEHMNFFVFENTKPDGKYYIDASQPGKFNLYWRQGANFTWRLPLDVLTPPKYCPVDGEKLSGKFEYCPYHGRKLKTTK